VAGRPRGDPGPAELRFQEPGQPHRDKVGIHPPATGKQWPPSRGFATTSIGRPRLQRALTAAREVTLSSTTITRSNRRRGTDHLLVER